MSCAAWKFEGAHPLPNHVLVTEPRCDGVRGGIADSWDLSRLKTQVRGRVDTVTTSFVTCADQSRSEPVHTGLRGHGGAAYQDGE